MIMTIAVMVDVDCSPNAADAASQGVRDRKRIGYI